MSTEKAKNIFDSAQSFAHVAVLISVPGNVPEQVWQVWGGTSVAVPMFSGLWAIANQQAGAPSVTGSIVDSNGTTAYNADQVMGGEPTAKFVSAIWDYSFLQDTALTISLGTDCSMAYGFGVVVQCNQSNALHTRAGWDNVTGVGTPNGQAFAPPAAPAKQ